MAKRQLSAEAIVLRGEKAIGELDLSVTTHADKARVSATRAAMVTLDVELANTKGAIAGLLYSLDVGYTAPEVIEDLRTMVKRWDTEAQARNRKRTP